MKKRSIIGSILSPLTVREKIGYILVLIALVSLVVVPNVMADDSRVGKRMISPSNSCTTKTNGWINAHKASGVPADNPVTSDNSALWTGGDGAIACNEFSLNGDTPVNAVINVRMSLAERSIQVETELALQSPRYEPVEAVDESQTSVAPNAFGQQTIDAVNAAAVISASNDGGETWQALQYVHQQDINDSALIAITLPDTFATDTAKLAIKLEPVALALEAPAILLDAVFVSYTVGEKTILELNPVSKTGGIIEEDTPAIEAQEQLTFELKSKDPTEGVIDGIIQQFKDAPSGSRLPNSTVELIHLATGKKTEVTSKISWQDTTLNSEQKWNVEVSMPDSVAPGEYRLSLQTITDENIQQVTTQDFLWGVLSLNTNKSLYEKNEIASIDMAVLDEIGATICDADVTLTVRAPNSRPAAFSTLTGDISIGDSCAIYGPHITPDYHMDLPLTENGKYYLNLKATTKNGTFEINDLITVAPKAKINIERQGPTRIFPPLSYPMTLIVRNKDALKGTVKEVVPKDFIITPGTFGKSYDRISTSDGKQVIEWDVDVQNNRTSMLSYTFDAPDISPEFYLLGAADITIEDGQLIFEENRQWQIAGDALGDDFKVQRGELNLSGTSTTITAGVDYDTPASASSAFIRINSTRSTASGVSSGGGTQDAADTTAYISNPDNLLTSIDFNRTGTGSDTHLAWEIIEYTGPSGGTNEFIVHDQSTTTFGSAALTADTPTISGISDDTDVVAWITGTGSTVAGSGQYQTGMATSEWIGGSDLARFTREDAGGDATTLSWAVVEFTGSNWKIQRVENDFTSTAAENETITTVNDTAKTFIYDQHRGNQPGIDDTGQEVWLQDASTVSFQMQANSGNQFGVAWIIENIQSSGEVMNVERGTFTKANNAGSEPDVVNVSYGPIADLTIASSFANARSTGTGTALPRGNFAVNLTSTSNLELWYSDNGQSQQGRWQTVEWPTDIPTTPLTAQSHYRWRDDSTALNTTGGWLAPEDTNLENVNKDSPLRIRMSVANKGTGTEVSARTYKLQYAAKNVTCVATSSWTDVNDAPNDAFDLVDSTFITSDGQATTSSLLTNSEAYSRVDGEGRDVADTTNSIGPLAGLSYSELEFSIKPTYNAETGQTYCFRLFDTTSATALDMYDGFPELRMDYNYALANVIGEAATFNSEPDGGWSTISFLKSYASPVVVGTTNSQNGERALVFESRNVTSTSAEMRVCESEGATANGCDTHASETVGYLVIDAAEAATAPGIEAGTFSVSGRSDDTTVTTNFVESFAAAPLVFANVNTVNSSEFPIEVVIPNTSATSFDAGICDHLLGNNDACDPAHGSETVGWVAIEPGSTVFSSKFDGGFTTGDSGTWTPVSFSTLFSDTPVVIAASQTDTGAQDVEIDEANAVTTSGFDIGFCEIDTFDTCDGHTSDTMAWAAFSNTPVGDQIALDQDTFRWYQNNNAVQPTTPRETENTTTTNVADADVVRLRVAYQVGEQSLNADTVSLKLQYGLGADCSIISTWSDVGAPGSGSIWRGYDNATPTNGANITTSLLNTGTNSLQSYVEQNNAPKNPNAITQGARGEWDFTLENNGATPESQYCFRAVTATDTEFHYSRYATLITETKPIKQLHYRWRDDTTALNTAGGYLGPEDATTTTELAKEAPLRLRISVANTDTPADSVSRAYQLQFADRTASNIPCDALGSWTSITASTDAFEMYDTTLINPDGQPTNTSLLSNSEGYTRIDGQARDGGDSTIALGPLNGNEYIELEYAMRATSSAVTGHTYCFRVYDALNATEIDYYAIYPEVTVQQAALGTGYSLDQDTFRIYENLDAATPTTPLAAENQQATNIADSQVVRVRLALQAGLQNVPISSLQIKLQYSSTATTCAAAAGWADIGASGSGTIWRAFNNPVTANNTTLPSSLLNGASNIPQSYTEATTTSSNPAVITEGSRGEWDFAIQNNGASVLTKYCFRAQTSSGTSLVYTKFAEVTTATSARIIMLYDGGTIPTDWTCISCTGGNDVFQRFLRGEATYGVTGGSTTHTHTADATVANNAAPSRGQTRFNFAVIDQDPHAHNLTPTIGAASNLPAYRQLKVIRYNFGGDPATLPAGVIGIFDATAPVGWTAYTAQNGNFVRGENTAGTTGGSNTHTHSITGTTGASTGGFTSNRTGGTQEGVAQDAHTHTVSGNSSSSSNEPPYIEVILARTAASTSVPNNMIAMWDSGPDTSWNCVSCIGGDPLYQRFFKPASTYGTTGGSDTNTHTSTALTTSPPLQTTTTRNGTANASSTHTHSVTIDNFSTTSNLPPYINVIFAKKIPPNVAPNSPTLLDQIRATAGTAIPTTGWTNENIVRFSAAATDTDNPDSLQLCVEVKPILTAFTDSPTNCGSLIAYSGTAVTTTVNVSGLVEGTYHWQARIRDSTGDNSAWVSYGANLETQADFGIDTTKPTGSVFDGLSTGIDLDYNSGELDQLSANWAITDGASGVANYDYSLGTAPGLTDIYAWTVAGLLVSGTQGGLTLNTSQIYYVNIRATDNAGNQQTISSDGLYVAPTLSFATSPSTVQFDNLNAGNSYSATQSTTLTTSTNAHNGYNVRAFLLAPLTSQNGDTVSDFNGGTYATPDQWLTGDVGYGYTSNDTLVNGLNRFSPGTCLGGGSPPCYAPFASSAPGDIIADHTAPIAGTALTDENFIITHRVTVDPDQPSGVYETEIVYTATAIY